MEEHTDLNESTQSMLETQEIDPSQPLSQMTLDGEDHEDIFFGILIPDNKDFPIYYLDDLDTKSYSFGRGPQEDFRFNREQFDDWIAISKSHFRLYRDNSGSAKEVFLEDKSFNGTFVNGRMVGKKQSSVLRRNDRITVANKSAKKGYIFFDNLKVPEWPSKLCKKYIMTKKIGEGAYGEVRLAFKQGRGTRTSFAVKILKMKNFPSTALIQNKKHQQQIINEIQLMKAIQHPFIIRLEDVIDDPECPEKIYLVLELAHGGDFFDNITSNTRLPEHTVKFYFYQLALAIQYLHERGITHRDIKPENILLETTDEETRLKLTDFGMSKLAADTTKMTTMCGTKTYMAPELLTILSTNTYNKKVDIWSMGVFLFVSLGGYPPFWDSGNITMEQKIVNGAFSFKHPQKIWDTISNDAKDLISKMLQKEPEKRLDITDTLKHPWLQDSKMKAKVTKLLENEQSICSPNRNKRKIDSTVDEENYTLQDAKTPRYQFGFHLDNKDSEENGECGELEVGSLGNSSGKNSTRESSFSLS